MRIGIPRESKAGERRVALVPRDVAALARAGHEVCVEAGAGSAVGHGDAAYDAAGAKCVAKERAWDCELVVKVKEILDADLAEIRAATTLFCFHHLPGEPERTRALAARGVTAIAFEMVRDDRGGFPILAAMSVLAGRIAVETLAPRLPSRARVLVLGAGHAGLAAAAAARERGDTVSILSRSAASRDAARDAGFTADIATPAGIEARALEADLVVGAVFVPAAPTPKLLPRALVRRMKRGAVIADISIDAGGVAETSRPTTHAEPTYVEEGVVHYCVANIPAASPVESADALSAAIAPHVEKMARVGIARSVREEPALRGAVLLWRGRVAHEGIAREAQLPHVPLAEAELA